MLAFMQALSVQDIIIIIGIVCKVEPLDRIRSKFSLFAARFHIVPDNEAGHTKALRAYLPHPRAL